ncbi:MAG TPA: DUF1801 domain-containing protein [Calditrichia bacterium]|nr:DUF1801 domain-containing protein [Calditrichota bacterium]HQV33170.1 DUF1801 domain-containing protein [Calditrichia bacterium]
MSQAQNKTVPNSHSVDAFLQTVDDEKKRADCFRILDMMGEITGEPPVMWGGSIVGFGTYHYKYESGREGDMLMTGFSPRKSNLTLYIMPGFGRYAELMDKLGKYKTGKSCLYIKRLADVDEAVLRELIDEGYRYMTEKYR